MKKAIVYYTNNKCAEEISRAVQSQLLRSGLDIISVSQKPMNFGQNIVVNFESSILNMFKQQLIGLEATDADIIYFAEHDVLYHPSHFNFIPPEHNIYYFNTNVWSIDSDNGRALYYDDKKMTSGTVAHRNILIEHYKYKIEWVEREGFFKQNIMGFEPGTGRGRTDDYKYKRFKSAFPNIDIKGEHNISKKRFNINQYRNRRRMEKSWVLSDRVPGWGITLNRFEEFLKELC